MKKATEYTYAATVERVVDGDTVFLKLTKVFELPIDFGFHILDVISLKKEAVVDFRLAGINASELTAAEPAVRAKAVKAKAELIRLLGLGALTVVTSKSEKYGRWLAAISVAGPMGSIDVNKAMLSGGFAVPYAG